MAKEKKTQVQKPTYDVHVPSKENCNKTSMADIKHIWRACMQFQLRYSIQKAECTKAPSPPSLTVTVCKVQHVYMYVYTDGILKRESPKRLKYLNRYICTGSCQYPLHYFSTLSTGQTTDRYFLFLLIFFLMHLTVQTCCS